MDIHKQFTVAVVKDEQGNKLAEEKFTNSEDNFRSFMQNYKPEETKIVIESIDKTDDCSTVLSVFSNG